MAKTDEANTNGGVVGLVGRWFEFDEEAEAEIAQMPGWVRPIVRYSSRGFGWGLAIVPVVGLLLGLFLIAGGDSEIRAGAEFDSLGACLDAVRDEFPQQQLRLVDNSPYLAAGVIEPSGKEFRCEERVDDSGVVIALTMSRDAATPAGAVQDEASWTIRNTRTMFLKPFDRSGDRQTEPAARPQTPQGNQAKRAKQVIPIPAGTGRCIAGCADFPNGFYDMLQ